MKKPQIYIFLASCLLGICIFLIHFLKVGTAVYGDGRYYYSYLPTILIQHTLNFSKTFRVYGLPFLYSPTHLLANPLAIGPAIIWTLPYLLGYTFTTLFTTVNPYNPLLQIPIGIEAVLLVFLGLFFLFLTLKKYFSQDIAFLVTLALFFTTNLFFYGAIDVLNSHSISFFFASLFIFLWLSKISVKNAIFLGGCLGMLILTRSQDALFILLPLYTLYAKGRNYIFYFFCTVCVTFLFLMPQFFLWHILWGGWFKSPYLYGASFHLLSPNMLGVLLNTYNGFFLWTPITIFATFGLILFFKKNTSVGVPFFLLVFAMLYLISTFEIWWGGASFSSRYMLSVLPLLAFGLCAFYQKYLSGKKQFLFSLFFMILNFILIFYFLIKK